MSKHQAVRPGIEVIPAGYQRFVAAGRQVPNDWSVNTVRHALRSLKWKWAIASFLLIGLGLVLEGTLQTVSGVLGLLCMAMFRLGSDADLGTGDWGGDGGAGD